jgi:hypothetical protein
MGFNSAFKGLNCTEFCPKVANIHIDEGQNTGNEVNRVIRRILRGVNLKIPQKKSENPGIKLKAPPKQYVNTFCYFYFLCRNIKIRSYFLFPLQPLEHHGLCFEDLSELTTNFVAPMHSKVRAIRFILGDTLRKYKPAKYEPAKSEG